MLYDIDAEQPPPPKARRLSPHIYATAAASFSSLGNGHDDAASTCASAHALISLDAGRPFAMAPFTDYVDTTAP